MAAETVHRQQREREQDAPSEIRDTKDVRQFFKHLLQDLDLATRLGYLFLSGFREFVSLHGDRGGEFAVPENLDWVFRFDNSGFAQHIGSDCRFTEGRQLLQVHDVKFFTEDVCEAALGHAAVQGHLAAFKTAHHA